MNPIDPRQQRPQRIAVLARRRHRQRRDRRGGEGARGGRRALVAAARARSTSRASADHYLDDRRRRCRPGRWTSSASDYAAIFIGAYGDPRIPDMRTPPTSCSASASSSTSTSTSGRASSTTRGSARSRARREKDVDFVVFRENTEGAYVGMGGNFKKGTPDEVAVQEEIHTRKGVERIVPRGVRLGARPRPPQGADERQVERHALRPRPLAARLLRGGGGVSRDRGVAPLRRRALHADGARAASSST